MVYLTTYVMNFVTKKYKINIMSNTADRVITDPLALKGADLTMTTLSNMLFKEADKYGKVIKEKNAPFIKMGKNKL